MSAQFARRDVLKIYQAIVCGRLPRAEGEINAALARHPTLRKRMAVAAKGGRAARTGFRVLEQLPEVARVEMRLHTGRTHQIRVHLEHLGCPVLGDLVYGLRQNRRLKEATGYAAPRQLLHAARLGLVHPRSRRQMTFDAPLPKDFAVTIKFFRVNSSRSNV